MNQIRIDKRTLAMSPHTTLLGYLPPHTEIISRYTCPGTNEIVINVKYDFDYWCRRVNESERDW